MKRTQIKAGTVRCLTLALAVGALAEAAGADVIKLASGETIIAEIENRTDDVVVVRHELFGRLEIPVASIVADGEASPDDVAPAAMQDEPAPAAPAEPPEKEWKASVVVAAGGSFGNTDTQNFSASVVASRENAASKTVLDAAYFWGSNNGDRDENKATAGILHDSYRWLPDPWLVYVGFRYDFDEFRSWDYRIQGSAGVGYRLIRKEDFKLTLRAGAGAVQEFNSDNDDIRPELMFGGDIEWNISEKQTLLFSSYVFPDLDDTGEFRTLSKASWDLLVDEESNMSLYAGVEHEYVSLVDPGRDHNDWTVRSGLKFDF